MVSHSSGPEFQTFPRFPNFVMVSSREYFSMQLTIFSRTNCSLGRKCRTQKWGVRNPHHVCPSFALRLCFNCGAASLALCDSQIQGKYQTKLFSASCSVLWFFRSVDCRHQARGGVPFPMPLKAKHHKFPRFMVSIFSRHFLTEEVIQIAKKNKLCH